MDKVNKFLELHKWSLRQTCYACPEQYDVLSSSGNTVGYLRLRHGEFTAEYPGCGGDLVYYAYPNGDGRFENDERPGFLMTAILSLYAKHLLNSDTSMYAASRIVIAKIRAKYNLTQEQFGAILSKNANTISRIETGTTRLSLKDAFILSSVFGIPIQEFFPSGNSVVQKISEGKKFLNEQDFNEVLEFIEFKIKRGQRGN